MRSISAAGFGVQSNKNRENDFKHGKAIHFAVVGALGTILFFDIGLGLGAIGLIQRKLVIIRAGSNDGV